MLFHDDFYSRFCIMFLSKMLLLFHYKTSKILLSFFGFFLFFGRGNLSIVAHYEFRCAVFNLKLFCVGSSIRK